LLRIDPTTVVKQRATGAGNMGDVQSDTDPVRFGLLEDYYLLWIRAKFSGGTGSATMQVKLRHKDRRGWIAATTDGRFDFVELEALTLGTGGTANFNSLVPADEHHRYIYDGGELLVPEWTNPNTQVWGIELGLAPVQP